jgi:hypothetical protein
MKQPPPRLHSALASALRRLGIANFSNFSLSTPLAPLARIVGCRTGHVATSPHLHCSLPRSHRDQAPSCNHVYNSVVSHRGLSLFLFFFSRSQNQQLRYIAATALAPCLISCSRYFASLLPSCNQSRLSSTPALSNNAPPLPCRCALGHQVPHPRPPFPALPLLGPGHQVGPISPSASTSCPLECVSITATLPPAPACFSVPSAVSHSSNFWETCLRPNATD